MQRRAGVVWTSPGGEPGNKRMMRRTHNKKIRLTACSGLSVTIIGIMQVPSTQGKSDAAGRWLFCLRVPQPKLRRPNTQNMQTTRDTRQTSQPEAYFRGRTNVARRQTLTKYKHIGRDGHHTYTTCACIDHTRWPPYLARANDLLGPNLFPNLFPNPQGLGIYVS